MSQILIRNLPPGTKEALRRRASAHGRSMEAEARAILVDFVMPKESDPVVLWLAAAEDLRAAGGGLELDTGDRHAPREVDLR